jgi:hypothetical protein
MRYQILGDPANGILMPMVIERNASQERQLLDMPIIFLTPGGLSYISLVAILPMKNH